MIIRFGQVNILIQALVSEIYYISNHWNFISNHCTSLYQVGAHFEALIEGVIMGPWDSRYSQVGFKLIPVQVYLSVQ